jgi:hypothetical protein
MAMAMELEKAISVETAAVILKRTPVVVRRYCRQKRFDAQLFSGTWVIDRKSFEDFAKKPRKMGRPKQSAKKRK